MPKTIYDEIEELEKEEGIEPEQKEETPEEVEEEPKEEAVEEPKEENAPKEEEKEEKKQDEDLTNLTPSGEAFARMRRENKALMDRLRALEEAKKEPVKQEVSEDKEPNKEENYEAWLEWRQRDLDRKTQEINATVSDLTKWRKEQEERKAIEHLTSAAKEELGVYERTFKSKAPDYDDAVTHGRAILKTAFLVTNPSADEKTVDKAVDRTIMQFASNAVNAGYDPAQAIYAYCSQRLGYKKAEPTQETKVEKKTPLKRIEANKARSASALAAGGGGGGPALSADAVATMSLGEFSHLTPAQLQEIEESTYSD